MASRCGQAHTGDIAIGEHPQRTPFYGIVILVGVMVLATIVAMVGAPAAVQVAVYIFAAALAILGGALTLRDLS